MQQTTSSVSPGNTIISTITSNYSSL